MMFPCKCICKVDFSIAFGVKGRFVYVFLVATRKKSLDVYDVEEY